MSWHFRYTIEKRVAYMYHGRFAPQIGHNLHTINEPWCADLIKWWRWSISWIDRQMERLEPENFWIYVSGRCCCQNKNGIIVLLGHTAVSKFRPTTLISTKHYGSIYVFHSFCSMHQYHWQQNSQKHNPTTIILYLPTKTRILWKLNVTYFNNFIPNLWKTCGASYYFEIK